MYCKFNICVELDQMTWGHHCKKGHKVSYYDDCQKGEQCKDFKKLKEDKKEICSRDVGYPFDL